MPSPQCENGYTRIANEIMDALVRTRIPGEQRQVLDFIIRKTYGFNQIWARITNSKLVESTGLTKQNANRSLKRLVDMKIVVKNDDNFGARYRFNKDYRQWKPYSKPTTVVNADYCSSQNGLPQYSKLTTPLLVKDNLKTILKTKDPGFAELPDSDTIDNAAPQKIDSLLTETCESIYKSGKWDKVHAFKNKAVKNKKNKRALLYALIQIAIRPIDEPWAYATEILERENGNFNEREHQKQNIA